ncbi:MAG TPA: hypothetical protein VEW93_01505 [Acidimicrobiales bacterium]|nr:hypothetical protein [Acidimicrobiales bacterium]
MTDPPTTDAADGFAARVQEVHVPEPNADREALLLRAGAVLVVLGLVLVGAGWFGASGTTDPAVQIPYAISGGAGGLGLVVVGAALITRFSLARLFRYWLARIVYEHQVQTDRTIEALGRIESALTNGAASPSSSSSVPPPVAGAAGTDGAGPAPRRHTEPLRAEPLES